jgi:glycosyltransferase involved in cell wall biosynthesis
MEINLMSRQKHIIISAVNLVEGGTLTVLQDCLSSATQCLPHDWKITALVHQKSLIENPRVQTIEFPRAKRSYLVRLWMEWFVFKKLSYSLKPDLWLSLHDITPRVVAKRQAVYCHNPSPFYRVTWREARLEPTFAFFNLLYKQLYGFFILRNYAVIVQQDWLRDAFRRLYSHPNVVVAYPTYQDDKKTGVSIPALRQPSRSNPLVLLYPALPRVFKNFELLCEAIKRLPSKFDGVLQLRLTLSGEENAYSRDLYQRFSSTYGVQFIGRQTRQQMEQQYRECDVVLFPSKLETWGLPITEAKAHSKPLLVADLPYARETVGNYESVTFLSAQETQAWAAAFEGLATGNFQFGSQFDRHLPDAPFAADWSQLWLLLTKDL